MGSACGRWWQAQGPAMDPLGTALVHGVEGVSTPSRGALPMAGERSVLSFPLLLWLSEGRHWQPRWPSHGQGRADAPGMAGAWGQLAAECPRCSTLLWGRAGSGDAVTLLPVMPEQTPGVAGQLGEEASCPGRGPAACRRMHVPATTIFAQAGSCPRVTLHVPWNVLPPQPPADVGTTLGVGAGPGIAAPHGHEAGFPQLQRAARIPRPPAWHVSKLRLGHW